VVEGSAGPVGSPGRLAHGPVGRDAPPGAPKGRQEGWGRGGLAQAQLRLQRRQPGDELRAGEQGKAGPAVGDGEPRGRGARDARPFQVHPGPGIPAGAAAPAGEGTEVGMSRRRAGQIRTFNRRGNVGPGEPFTPRDSKGYNLWYLRNRENGGLGQQVTWYGQNRKNGRVFPTEAPRGVRVKSPLPPNGGGVRYVSPERYHDDDEGGHQRNGSKPVRVRRSRRARGFRRRRPRR